MQAKWGREIRDLVRGEPFLSWFRQYNILRDNSKSMHDRLSELRTQASLVALKADAIQHNADDFVYMGGELDDMSMMASAEFADIENTSFEILSEFETERKRSTEAWEAGDRMEKLVEDHRQRLSEGKARIEAARRVNTPEGKGEAERLQSRMRELEETLKELVSDSQVAKDRMAKLSDSKNRLWTGVEEAWSRTFRAAMARAEHSYRARRARAQAEDYFARASTERRRADSMIEDARIAEQQLQALKSEYEQHLERGRTQFGCVLVDEFLFWPQQGNVAAAWVVPLVDEAQHLNLQVAALQLYQVERNRGLDLVEPVPEELESPNDERLDAFFSAQKAAASAPGQDRHS